MDTQPDKIDSLMTSVQYGEKAALDALYELMSPGLFGYLRRMGCPADDAADLLQTTFLKIWQFRNQFRGQQASAWIYTILLNSWRDQVAQRKHWPDILYEEATDVREDLQNCPHSVLTAERLARRLQVALMGLSPVLREAVVLSRFSGLGIRDMARVLGTSEANVKIRIHRGLILLKQALIDSDTSFAVGDTHE